MVLLSALQRAPRCVQHLTRRSRCQSLPTHLAFSSVRFYASHPGVTKTNNPSSSQIPINHVRNIGIIAHIDAGKTTTTERMLYYSGMTHRIGDVDEGSTIMDFLPAERARGITIQSAAITFNWPPLGAESTYPSHTINLIDTPGHADFTFEVERSIRVLDGAVTILDGVAGVEAQTEKVWRQADRYNIPRIVFVNKLDREGAEFGRVVREVAARLGVMPAVVQIPLLEVERDPNAARVGGEVFVGVVDVVEMKVVRWQRNSDGRNMEVFPLEDLKETKPRVYEEAVKARAALVEVLTTVDDVLVEKYLEVEDAQLISPGDIKTSLRFCTLNTSTQVIPVLAGAAFKNMGVQPLLDAVLSYLPSPMEAGKDTVAVSVQGEKSVIKASESGNLCALAFKVVQDAKRGVLVYVRVYSGTLTRGTNLFNTSLQTKEKALRLLRMYANEPHDIEAIPTGHIGVIVGLKHARTGDTLINASNLLAAAAVNKHAKRGKKHESKVNKPTHDALTDSTLQLRPITVPPPVFFASLEPSSLSEQRNLEDSLTVLLREDPSLHTSVDEDSGQTLLSGMGELHLEISKDRLVNDLKAKASMGSIRIGYREVIAGRVDALEKTHAREANGREVSASVFVDIEAIREDEVDSDIDDMNTISRLQIDGNEVIVNLLPPPNETGVESTELHDPFMTKLPVPLTTATLAHALTIGAQTALSRGPTLNFPLHSTRVILTLEPPASGDAPLSSYTAVARMAVIGGIKGVGTQLMEPVMNVVITVDDSDLGVVVGDISSGGGGGTVLSLDDDTPSDPASASSSSSSSSFNTSASDDTAHVERASIDPTTVYAPPDSYLSNAISSDHGSNSSVGRTQSKQRNIRARVPLKKMVGYMNHLRSLTKGRGTFVMSVDRFERMSENRVRGVMGELRG